MGALEEVRDLAQVIARRRSLLLWDVEVQGSPGRAIVRVFVDAEEGEIDLDTVTEVSEELSRGLDLRDPIKGRYTLEVSSPGLERWLKTPEHFERSVGKKVVVKTTEQLVAKGHRIDGVIVEADAEGVRLEADGEPIEVPYSAIKQARTVFEW